MTATKETKTYRRVVTGHNGDKAVFKSDEQLRAYVFKAVPELEET